MNNETKYNSFDNAYLVMKDDNEVGRVWYDEETEWNLYVNETDLEYDFVDSFNESVEMVLEG